MSTRIYVQTKQLHVSRSLRAESGVRTQSVSGYSILSPPDRGP